MLLVQGPPQGLMQRFPIHVILVPVPHNAGAFFMRAAKRLGVRLPCSIVPQKKNPGSEPGSGEQSNEAEWTSIISALTIRW